MVGGTTLNGQRDDLAGLGVGFVLEPGLDLLDLHGGLVSHVGLQLAEEIGFRLLRSEAGDLLQHIHLLLLEPFRLRLGGLQPGQAVGQMLLFPLHVLRLAVQVLFLLLKPAFLFLKVAPALLSSRSYSLRALRISSFDSRRASRFLFSALLYASLTICFAWFFAEFRSSSACFRSRRTPNT